MTPCNDTWFFLDAWSGTPVRCVADPTPDYPTLHGEWSPGGAQMECATRLDGLACQWGELFHRHTPYEPLTGVVSGTPIRYPCPGWPTNDGTSACEALGCYNASNSSCGGSQPNEPPARVQRGWLFSVFIDENGRVGFSENQLHPSESLEGVVAWVASVVLVIVVAVCCCLAACHVGRRRALRALALMRRRESRLAIELATSRRKGASGGAEGGEEEEEEPLRETGVAVAIEEDAILAASVAAGEEPAGEDSVGGEGVVFAAPPPRPPAKRVSFAAAEYFVARSE